MRLSLRTREAGHFLCQPRQPLCNNRIGTTVPLLWRFLFNVKVGGNALNKCFVLKCSSVCCPQYLCDFLTESTGIVPDSEYANLYTMTYLWHCRDMYRTRTPPPTWARDFGGTAAICCATTPFLARALSRSDMLFDPPAVDLNSHRWHDTNKNKRTFTRYAAVGTTLDLWALLGPSNITEASQDAGVTRVVHMSSGQCTDDRDSSHGTLLPTLTELNTRRRSLIRPARFPCARSSLGTPCPSSGLSGGEKVGNLESLRSAFGAGELMSAGHDLVHPNEPP